MFTVLLSYKDKRQYKLMDFGRSTQNPNEFRQDPKQVRPDWFIITTSQQSCSLNRIKIGLVILSKRI